MKKFLMIAAAAMFIGTAGQAQTANDVKKQQGGEQNLEFMFAPFGGTPISTAGIKYRSFTSATSAWRVNIFLGFNSDTDVHMGGSDGETELKDVNSSFSIEIAPGMEWHFVGTDRLSPYYGAEASVGFSSQNQSMQYTYGKASEGDVITNKVKDGSLNIGVNGFAGMDFYIAEDIYLGAEMGFGIGFTSMFDTVASSDAEGAEDVTTPNGSSISVGPTYQGKIRLGFLF